MLKYNFSSLHALTFTDVYSGVCEYLVLGNKCWLGI